MSDMPKVSVIVPVCNAERYLRQCLDSIIWQSLDDIEVVCVDNGSTDGSIDILKHYEQKDCRVRILYGGFGKGAGAARNIGLAAAKGEWLHFVDADDFLELDAERLLVAYAETSGADIVVYGADEYDDPTGIRTPLPLDLSVAAGDDKFLRAYSTCPWNKLFRRSFIIDSKILFQEIPRSNDIAFTVEALCRAPKVVTLNSSLYRYRIHGQGGLQQTKFETPFAWQEALEEACKRLKSAGIYERYSVALGILSRDVRYSNVGSLPLRVFVSIYRRGLASFLKHALGVVIKRLKR